MTHHTTKSTTTHHGRQARAPVPRAARCTPVHLMCARAHPFGMCSVARIGPSRGQTATNSEARADRRNSAKQGTPRGLVVAAATCWLVLKASTSEALSPAMAHVAMDVAAHASPPPSSSPSIPMMSPLSSDTHEGSPTRPRYKPHVGRLPPIEPVPVINPHRTPTPPRALPSHSALCPRHARHVGTHRHSDRHEPLPHTGESGGEEVRSRVCV
jgi:hypothetical protein